MLQTIKKYLLQIIDDIDAGNSNADEEELIQIARFLNKTVRKDKPMNKYQAYTYLGMSRASFDNKVREGLIPKGRKEAGSRELKWYKKDLPRPKKK
mgnify:CR=1 FL=1